MSELFAVRWVEAADGGPAVQVLDQTRLPAEEVVVDCRDVDTLAEAIRSLRVRGAPALGVAGAYGVVLGSISGQAPDAVADTIAGQRPTAVNLGWAARRVAAAGPDVAGMLAEARRVEAENAAACREMGRLGAEAVEQLRPGGPTRMLTHCNTGMLACQGIGTAFGVARTLFEDGGLGHLWVDETRPLLQGARLTAFEARALGMPYSVLVDGAAGSLMAAGDVDVVAVGADRIAANGDTANKVGTYTLAVLAARHEIPFVVVAPISTIDLATPDGAAIEVEERAEDEVRTAVGLARLTPKDSPARNPAFDVTPADLITAIVTERGVAKPVSAERLAALVEG
jgi:methylthioribose-1-phosphate isomerase